MTFGNWPSGLTSPFVIQNGGGDDLQGCFQCCCFTILQITWLDKPNGPGEKHDRMSDPTSNVFNKYVLSRRL